MPPTSVMPRRARPWVPVSGLGACGGRASNALKKGNLHAGWTTTKCGNIRAGTTIGSRRCWRIFFSGGSSCAWGKKAPALTVSQLRTILDVVLPLRTYTIEEVLAFVAWVQQRNHRAYLAHRKRRETES